MSLKTLAVSLCFSFCLASAAILPLGCNSLSTIQIPTQSDPIRPAEYPLVYKDGPKKGQEIKVALLIACAPGVDPAFAGSPEKLAMDIYAKLPEVAKEARQQIAVLDPSSVHKFKLKNQNWNRMHDSELGRRLKADYVLDIRLDKMTVYRPGSQNSQYEGSAEVAVEVYDVDAGIAEPKYRYNFAFHYPPTGTLDPTAISALRFKEDYLKSLAVELINKHVEHKAAHSDDDKTSDAKPK